MFEIIKNYLSGILEGIQAIFEYLKGLTEGVAIVSIKLANFRTDVLQALSVFPTEIIIAAGSLVALLVVLAALRWGSGG